MWTPENTDGFTRGELRVLNCALSVLAAEFEEVEPANINDMLNNAWTRGATVEGLIADVRRACAGWEG